MHLQVVMSLPGTRETLLKHPGIGNSDAGLSCQISLLFVLY